MKKLMFVMPLMAISLLASCGGSSPSPMYHIVSFDTDGGSFISPQQVENGKTAIRPTKNPTKIIDSFAYTFEGWFKDDQDFVFEQTPITSDITIKAKWSGTPTPSTHRTLTYHYQNGTPEDTYEERYYNDDKTKQPTWQPAYAGHTFVGWYVEPGEGETGTKYPFNNALSDNDDAYAHWISTPAPTGSYSVAINCMNCSVDGSSSYNENLLSGTTTQRAIQCDEGYDIPAALKKVEGAGASCISYNNGIISISNLNGDVTITVEAVVKKHTITFNPNGGSLVGQTSIGGISNKTNFYEIPNINDQKATRGLDVFVGWALTSTDKVKIPENYLVEGSFTVYAIFIPQNTATITLSNTSANCQLVTSDGDTIMIGNSITVAAGMDINFSVEPLGKKLPVFKNNLTVTGANTCSFDSESKKLTVNVAPNGTCNITAKTEVDLKSDLKSYSWKEIEAISKGGVAPAMFHLGEEKTILINNQSHRVRIIGFNHDELSDSTTQNPKYAGITFEFVNAISDSSGFAIVSQWNDTSEYDSASHSYLNSSVRRLLNSETNEGFLWAEKGQTDWSNTYTSSVINMLVDDDLNDYIKPVKKYVLCKENNEWVPKLIETDGVGDKLFLLSPREVGDNTEFQEPEEYTSTYAFFEGAKNKDRVKKQVSGTIESTSSWEISADKRHQYGDIVKNFGGYNASSDDSLGISYWLRTPYSYEPSVCIGTFGGEVGNNNSCKRCYAIAPAFCI